MFQLFTYYIFKSKHIFVLKMKHNYVIHSCILFRKPYGFNLINHSVNITDISLVGGGSN